MLWTESKYPLGTEIIGDMLLAREIFSNKQGDDDAELGEKILKAFTDFSTIAHGLLKKGNDQDELMTSISGTLNSVVGELHRCGHVEIASLLPKTDDPEENDRHRMTTTELAGKLGSHIMNLERTILKKPTP